MAYKTVYSRWLAEQRARRLPNESPKQRTIREAAERADRAKLAAKQKEEERLSRLVAEDKARQRAEALLAERNARRRARKESDEMQLLRLLRIKPAKLDCIKDVENAQIDVRQFLDDSNPDRHISVSRQARLKLLGSDLDDRRSELLQQERKAKLKAKRKARTDRLSAKAAVRQFSQSGQDYTLAGVLWDALDNTPPVVGYLYLKRWSMSHGSCWFKIGITNNPARREAEQNVMPVPQEVIACVDVGSMDRARAMEAVMHRVLDEQRINDANNRELFRLTDEQAAAVKAVMERLG